MTLSQSIRQDAYDEDPRKAKIWETSDWSLACCVDAQLVEKWMRGSYEMRSPHIQPAFESAQESIHILSDGCDDTCAR